MRPRIFWKSHFIASLAEHPSPWPEKRSISEAAVPANKSAGKTASGKTGGISRLTTEESYAKTLETISSMKRSRSCVSISTRVKLLPLGRYYGSSCRTSRRDIGKRSLVIIECRAIKEELLSSLAHREIASVTGYGAIIRHPMAPRSATTSTRAILRKRTDAR